MAKNDTASIIPLHQPKPKTAAERGRAYRKRQRKKSAVRSRKSAPSPADPIEKSKTFANGGPAFAELEKSTAELVASCQRGIEAARLMGAFRFRQYRKGVKTADGEHLQRRRPGFLRGIPDQLGLSAGYPGVRPWSEPLEHQQ